MEKITKEELKNLMGGKALSDEELEQVAGGSGGLNCEKTCQILYDVGDPRLISCMATC